MMEETDQRKSLMMKYARRVGGHNSKSQEDLAIACENNALDYKELSSFTEPHQKPLLLIPQDETETIPKYIAKASESEAKLDQNKILEATQIADLQKSEIYRRKIREQEDELLELNMTLQSKIQENEKFRSELNLLKKTTDERERKLFQLKEAVGSKNCSFYEFYEVVLNMSKKLMKLSSDLQTQLDQVAEKTEQIATLQTISEEQVMTIKGLEKDLNAETTKCKKMENELNCLSKSTNEQKKNLSNDFDQFKRETELYLRDCNSAREVILNIINSDTEY